MFLVDFNYIPHLGGEAVEVKKLPIRCGNFSYDTAEGPFCKEDATYVFSYESEGVKYFCDKHAKEYAAQHIRDNHGNVVDLEKVR